MKQARVSVLKHNVQVGDQIPHARNDAVVGQWADSTLSQNYYIDKSGVLDMPNEKIDNKTRKKGSKAHHTVGSQTIEKWVSNKNFKDTDIFKKVQNQNQITYDSNFDEVIKVQIVDFDIDIVQDALSSIYENLREKIVNGNRDKSIYSDCKRGIAECYTHPNSYKLRLTDKYMKQIQNIAGNRDTFNKFIELL
jgi:hypothetical protein